MTQTNFITHDERMQRDVATLIELREALIKSLLLQKITLDALRSLGGYFKAILWRETVL